MNAAANQTGRTRKLTRLWKYALSAVIFGVAIAAAIGLQAFKKAPKNRKSITGPMQVKVEKATKFSGEIGFDINGVVVPHQEIKIAPEVAGRIVEKSPKCQAGKIVRKDDILYKIDHEDYQNDVDQAEAELQQAINSLEEKQAELAGAEKTKKLAEDDFRIQKNEYDKRKELKQQDAISASELLQAEMSKSNAEQAKIRADNALASLKKNIARLKQAKTLSEKRKEKAKLNLTRCTIKSPIDGIIVRDMAEEGDFVQRGTQIAIVEDYAKVEVQCNLRPDQIQWLWENSPRDQSKSDQRDDGQDSTTGPSTLGPSPNSLSSKAETTSSQLQSSGIQDIDEIDLKAFQVPRINVEIEANFGNSDEQFVWNGVLESLDGMQLDEMTKMVPCRIVVRERVVNRTKQVKQDDKLVRVNVGNDKRALLRGMFVKAEFKIDTEKSPPGSPEFIQFPAVAVQPGNYVWTTYLGPKPESYKGSADSNQLVPLVKRHKVKIADRLPPDPSRQFDKYVVVRIDPSQKGIELGDDRRTGILPGDQIILTPMAQAEPKTTVVEVVGTEQETKSKEKAAN